MQEFNFQRPDTLSSLIGILADSGGTILAGGTDIIPKMRRSDLSVTTLVDISQIDELRFIRKSDQKVQIGSLVTHQEIADSNTLAQVNPALVDAALSVGCEQTRNRGTLGGNIANASPSADTIPALMIFDADVHLLGVSGEKTISLNDFLIGPGKKALQPDQFITHVSFKTLSGACGTSFVKLGKRKGMAVSVVNGAALIVLDSDGKITHIRICLGAVAPVVVRCPNVEMMLIDQYPSLELLEASAQHCFDDISPIDDVRSNAIYRRHAASVITRRVLSNALDRARSKLV